MAKGKARYFVMVKDTMLHISLVLLLALSIASLIVLFVPQHDSEDPENIEFIKSNMSTEQRIYYKIFKRVIKEDCPNKPDGEVKLLAALLSTSSKHIPYFAGLVYVESLKPEVWRRGRRVRRAMFWQNFTIMNDSGSPSLGYVKIKMSVIRSLCRMDRVKPPSFREIKVKDPEWTIKLFRWAGRHYDYMVKVFGDPVKGIAAYKYGPVEFKKYLRRNGWVLPYKIIGKSIEKAAEYQSYYIKYVNGDTKWKQERKKN